MDAAPGPLSSRWLELRTADEVCELVEDLPPEAIGELSFEDDDGAPRGLVFVEKNRICWAAAPGLSRRLTDLLRARVDVRAGVGTLEEVFLSCKATRRPLGETLVRSGIVAARDLRSALLAHTAESIIAMVGGRRSRWMPRAHHGYDAQFTFATGEILAELAATRFADEAGAARAVLQASLDEGDVAVAFVRGGEHAQPVPVATFGDCEATATVLRQVGRWASGISDLASAIEERAELVALARGSGTAVAWVESGLLLVAVVGERGFARIVSRRAHRRRQRV